MDIIQQLRDEVLRIWGEMNRWQKILVGVLGVSTLLALGLLAIWAGRTEYTTAYTDLSEEDAAAIVDILQNQGVPHQLAAGGTTIRVPEPQIHQVRLDVAREGLPRGGAVGFELFDRGGLANLGMTEFTQRVNYQRALEGELSRTISTINEVEQARVYLVIPEETLFTQNKKEPTASIMVELKPGRSLREDQIWGIGNLTASSVEGLKAENVTIVDVHGQVLAEGTASQATSRSNLRLTMAQMDAERSVERSLEEEVQRMLDTALGPNKALVRINAELEWDQVETTSEQFETQDGGQTGVVRSLRQSIESTGGAAAVTGGVPGVDANVLPIYQPVITGTQGAGGVIRQDSVVNYELSKTVKRTVDNPGDVKRLSVAVVLNSNDDTLIAQQPAIEQMVQAAVGYNADRGDAVTVDLVPFDDRLAEEARAMEEAQRRAEYMSLARLGAAILGLLIVLFFVHRAFRRLEEQVFVDLGPAQVPQLEGPVRERRRRPDKRATEEGVEGLTEDLTQALTTDVGEMTSGELERLIGEAEHEMELDVEDIRRRKRMNVTAQEQPEAVARVIQRWLEEEE